MSNITDPYYLLQVEQEKTKKLELKLNYRKFLIRNLMKLNIDLLNDTDEKDSDEEDEDSDEEENADTEDADTEDKVDTEDELNLDDFAKKMGIIKKSKQNEPVPYVVNCNESKNDEVENTDESEGFLETRIDTDSEEDSGNKDGLDAPEEYNNQAELSEGEQMKINAKMAEEMIKNMTANIASNSSR
jgi:hypothetical protein